MSRENLRILCRAASRIATAMREMEWVVEPLPPTLHQQVAEVDQRLRQLLTDVKSEILRLREFGETSPTAIIDEEVT